ncbi:MAG: ATP-binding protein [Bacteroidota bacterium]
MKQTGKYIAELRKLLTCFLLVIIFLFIGCIGSKADNTYRYSFSNYEYHDGGEIILSNSENSKAIITYFIKPNWAGESEVIYTWRDIRRKNAKGSIRNVFVIASQPLNGNLLAVWKDNSRLLVANLDSLTNIISVCELVGEWFDINSVSAKWLGRLSQNSWLLKVENHFYSCLVDGSGKLSVHSLFTGALEAVSLYEGNASQSQNTFAYITGQEGWAIIYFSNSLNEDIPVAHLQLPDEIFLYRIGHDLAVVTSTKSSKHSLLQIITKEKGIVSGSWIESAGGHIKVVSAEDKKYVYFLSNVENNYFLRIAELKDLNDRTRWTDVALPLGFIEPQSFQVIGDKIIITFRNGLVTTYLDGTILSADYLTLGEMFFKEPTAFEYDKYLILSSPTASLVLVRDEHSLWFVNRFLNSTGTFLIPGILIVVLMILIGRYRKNKRLLDAVLDLPSSGFVFVIDRSGRLIRANDSGKNLLGISASVPLNKMFLYYAVTEQTKPISDLVEKGLSFKDTIAQKISIMDNGSSKEWFCTVLPLKNIAGLYRGMVFTGIDITEELEKKRLSNWASLAHDMQTNLSTIRLNAEQMEYSVSSEDNERRKKIIHQVNVLMQRVRDVVTVGRSDALELQSVNAASVCVEARIEFDEDLFPNIDFEVKILNFNLTCDKPKMVRALRNAIENSIRAFQGREGIIRISCHTDGRNAYFSIQDNGIGMDEETKHKMLTPYFTTSKKQGGTGIGTMIMQHVVQLHGGELSVVSEKGVGTEITFSIPIYNSTKFLKHQKNHREKI